jgi:hypothetical protein
MQRAQRELRPYGRRLRRDHSVWQLYRAADVRRRRLAEQLRRQQQLQT